MSYSQQQLSLPPKLPFNSSIAYCCSRYACAASGSARADHQYSGAGADDQGTMSGLSIRPNIARCTCLFPEQVCKVQDPLVYSILLLWLLWRLLLLQPSQHI